jgi:hypothetical protein
LKAIIPIHSSYLQLLIQWLRATEHAGWVDREPMVLRATQILDFLDIVQKASQKNIHAYSLI